MLRMTIEEVLQIVYVARTQKEQPDFSGLDMRRSKLGEFVMIGADLNECDLRGSNLTKTIMTGANMTDANLTGTEGDPTRRV